MFADVRSVSLLLSIVVGLSVFQCGVSESPSCTMLRKSTNDSQGLAFDNRLPRTSYAFEGFYKRLYCRSYNFCNITWFFNGRRFGSWDLNPQFNDYFLDATNETLTFKSVYSDATGNYTCLVTDGNTTIRRDINLVVEEPVWNNKPVLLASKDCVNKTAVIGGNVSFYCRFYVGNAGFESGALWLKYGTNETNSWWNVILFIHIEGTSFASTHTLETYGEKQERTVIGLHLNITNVTEAAFGIYQARCFLPNYVTRFNVTLSPALPPPTRVINMRPIILTICILLGIFIVVSLAWKFMAIDIQLWYHDHLRPLTEDEGKVYDAYISFCCLGDDKDFVYNILVPSLKDRYKVFLRSTDNRRGEGTYQRQQIINAMSKSRRCIVVLSRDFCRPSSAGFTNWGPIELQHARDLMRAHRIQIIPLIYRDFDVNVMDSSSDVTKLVKQVSESIQCLRWKQKSTEHIDTRVMKRLRLRLPPRRPKRETSSAPISALPPSSVSSTVAALGPVAVIQAESPTYDTSGNNFTNFLTMTGINLKLSSRGKGDDQLHLIDNEVVPDHLTIDVNPSSVSTGLEQDRLG